MSNKTITATLAFKYLVNEEEPMEGMSEEEQIEYVRESTLDYIAELNMSHPETLASFIQITVEEEN